MWTCVFVVHSGADSTDDFDRGVSSHSLQGSSTNVHSVGLVHSHVFDSSCNVYQGMYNYLLLVKTTAILVH